MNTGDSKSEILNSWKEVAQYLGRGVRTVQRWEHDLGLPVRRPRGTSRSPVVALREELDYWLVDTPQAINHRDGNGMPVALGPKETLHVTAIIVESRDLRSKARELRKEMSGALHTLILNLERIHGNCDNGDAVLCRGDGYDQTAPRPV